MVTKTIKSKILKKLILKLNMLKIVIAIQQAAHLYSWNKTNNFKAISMIIPRNKINKQHLNLFKIQTKIQLESKHQNCKARKCK